MPPQLHSALGWILVLATLGCAAFWVPAEAEGIRASYLIFFIHFPSAFSSLIFFTAAGVLAAASLLRPSRLERLDHWSASAVEIGVVASTVTLLTGSVWAKAAWGIFWDFRDKRLMTVAIMWFTYAAYLALRGAVEEPGRRARYCAVFAALATINVPLVYFAIRWFGTASHSHPASVSVEGAAMNTTQWLGAAAFLVLYSALWRLRRQVLRAEDEAGRLDDAFSRSGM
ncbi:MAG: cytochrome c biogenesis protein CcsA [Planctomycetes bacterium]|nr:cytochrome c biogenesis protein CcsA [Planctomycetota bacterium]